MMLSHCPIKRFLNSPIFYWLVYSLFDIVDLVEHEHHLSNRLIWNQACVVNWHEGCRKGVIHINFNSLWLFFDYLDQLCQILYRLFDYFCNFENVVLLIKKFIEFRLTLTSDSLVVCSGVGLRALIFICETLIFVSSMSLFDMTAKAWPVTESFVAAVSITH